MEVFMRFLSFAWVLVTSATFFLPTAAVASQAAAADGGAVGSEPELGFEAQIGGGIGRGFGCAGFGHCFNWRIQVRSATRFKD